MAQSLPTATGSSLGNAPGNRRDPALCFLPLSGLPRLLEQAMAATSTKRIQIPTSLTPEPEFPDHAEVKGFAYHALARIAEHYWNEILAWRRRNPESLGLTLPGAHEIPRETFSKPFKEGSTVVNPGAISLNLMHQVKLLTTTFASLPHSERWMEQAKNDTESQSLACYLRLSPVEFRLAAGLNSAFARTFELQAELLNALAEQARSQDTHQAYLALSVLSSPELLSCHFNELHKLLKYLSSVHFDHFKLVNDWMSEQKGQKNLFIFAQSNEAPGLRVGVSTEAAAVLQSRISGCVPLSSRHGCPASAARTVPAEGSEIRSVMHQAFTWIEEINATFLFPLVAELYSRQAPSMAD